jgi:hypothetical protein
LPTLDKALYGNDGLGNEVFKGDAILIRGDEFYLKETLEEQSQELLSNFGFVEKTA